MKLSIAVLVVFVLGTTAQAHVEGEATARLMLEEPASSGERFAASLQRILRLSYRAEHRQRGFERALDERLAKKPGAARPMETAAYAELQRIRAARETELHAWEEIASSLLAMNDARARQVLAPSWAWLRERTAADLLQLLDLAPVLARMDFPSWLQEADLSAKFRESENEIFVKASEAARWTDLELEIDSFQRDLPLPLPVPRVSKVKPSAGKEGNFIGTEMAPNEFVLTYDDGPGDTATSRLLTLLTSHKDSVNQTGAPATFFVLMARVKAVPQVFAEIKRLGFPINNHSWSHANFAKLDSSGLRHEIFDSTTELENLLGKSFRFFRCPYGACIAPKVPEARQLIAAEGLIHAYWTIDSLDWKNLGNPRRTFDLVTKQMKSEGRGVILMHDIHASTVDASKLVLDWIKEQNAKRAGYRLFTLERAVDRVNAR